MIEKHSGTKNQELFHKYVAALYAHFYISTCLSKNSVRLQKEIKNYESEITSLKNKIANSRVIMGNQETKLGAHKTKYDRVCLELQNCQ